MYVGLIMSEYREKGNNLIPKDKEWTKVGEEVDWENVEVDPPIPYPENTSKFTFE